VAVLHVRLDLVGHDIVTRRLHLPLPVRDVRTLRTLALLDLESVTLGAPVERITIAVDPTPGKVLQHALFERAQPAPEQIATLVARLGALMGQDRVGAAATVDTYRPGAFTMHTFAPAAPAAAMRARGERLRPVPSANARGAASGGGASRAVVSAGPRASIGVSSTDGFPGMLRRCRRPVPARVALAEGRPVRVDGDRQSFAGGAVRQAAGPWRVSGEWWITHPTHQTHAAHAAPFDRVEWDVALADGAVFRIFQEQTTGRWFIDGGMD
jgi:protein ImuB